jgi:dinuclear metal center YbgI/SA1388 family protein
MKRGETMIEITTLLNYLNALFEPEKAEDHVFNGWQVQGRFEISKLITGVTANQALLDAAIQLNADAILVHHGYFWKNENPSLVGIKFNRIATLIRHQINLIAYHLPLDVHPVYGNNVQLASKLDLKIIQQDRFLCIGQLKQPVAGDRFAAKISEALNREPFYIPGCSSFIQKIAWCTGKGGEFIEAALAHGVDAFLTGEASLKTVDVARETGLHFYAAGHHATERYGVQAVGEHLSEKFGLEHQFIDIDNPI